MSPACSPDPSSAAITNKGVTEPLAIGPDILLGPASPNLLWSMPHGLQSATGLHMPDVHYDDFAEMDLKGKVIVLINGGPPTFRQL